MTYRTIDPTALDRAAAYTLFITAVVPRPIGWVSTQATTGLTNAAPFSWFNAVCGDPLMLMVAVGKRRGAIKDTARNILDTGEFVVNVATAANGPAMVQSSADYAADVSEFDAVGLTAVPSTHVAPRIGESPIHFECTLEHHLEFGTAPTDLIIGRCVALHIDESVLADDGRVDALKLAPLAQLGRDEYAVVNELVRYGRPEG